MPGSCSEQELLSYFRLISLEPGVILPRIAPCPGAGGSFCGGPWRLVVLGVYVCRARFQAGDCAGWRRRRYSCRLTSADDRKGGRNWSSLYVFCQFPAAGTPGAAEPYLYFPLRQPHTPNSLWSGMIESLCTYSDSALCSPAQLEFDHCH